MLIQVSNSLVSDVKALRRKASDTSKCSPACLSLINLKDHCRHLSASFFGSRHSHHVLRWDVFGDVLRLLQTISSLSCAVCYSGVSWNFLTESDILTVTSLRWSWLAVGRETFRRRTMVARDADSTGSRGSQWGRIYWRGEDWRNGAAPLRSLLGELNMDISHNVFEDTNDHQTIYSLS
jgi:hypothetical protein